MYKRYNPIGQPVYANHKPLRKEDIITKVPAIMAENPYNGCSENYQYISTAQVLNALWKEGYGASFAVQSRSRIEGKEKFTKHMVRLRPRDTFDTRSGDGVAEIILVNSHDKTSSYRLYAGYFRFVCQNGLVSGDISTAYTVQHRGNIGDIIESVGKVARQTKEIEAIRDAMKAKTLTYQQQMQLASEALDIRFNGESPISPEQALWYRRHEDKGNDAWSTFNRLQENIMKGGQRGYNANGNRIKTRPIRNIDNMVKVNREIWTLAQELVA